jgi:hypothetical protein
MDQIRNFTQTNRSSIVNLIYMVAAVVLVYYLVMYYMDSDYKDLDLLARKLSTDSFTAAKSYDIATSDSNKYRAKSEYTLSFWIYVNSYNGTAMNKSILALFDDVNQSGTTKVSLLTFALHPNMPKMIIRALNGTSSTTDAMNKFTQSGTGASTNYTWDGRVPNATMTDSLEPCDIMDVDVQRWMNIAVSVNGRIMDVYMDGKLARSCILTNTQQFGATSNQYVVLMPSGFNGHVSGIRWSNYAVTPDVIYGRYQSGPYFGTSFLDYLVDKIGIKISYTGVDGETSSDSIWSGILKTT